MAEQAPTTHNIDPSSNPLAEAGPISPVAGGLGEVGVAGQAAVDLIPAETPAEYLARNFPVEYGALKEAEAGAEVTRLDSFIAERSAEALRNSEFEESKELKESLDGFYHDHYYLGGAVKAVTEGNYEAPIFGAIKDDPKAEKWESEMASRLLLPGDEGYRDSPNAKIATLRIAKMVNEFSRIKSVLSDEQTKVWQFNILKQCGAAVNEVLFAETSVGITSVGEQEIALARDLAASLQAASGGRIIAEGKYRVGFNSPDEVENGIKNTVKTFWNDTRHAGQLEFHESPNIGSINLYGLMSRNAQLRKNGRMNAQTAVNFGGSTMHSVVSHFSEFFNDGAYAVGDEGGTLAIPLIKIIREAPYGRDAQYGLLRPKTEAAIKDVPLKTLDQPTGTVGAGAPDAISPFGRDRVFFASPDERSDTLPDDYTINMHDKQERGATYIIDRNHFNTSSGRELHNLGVGYGFPERVVIEKGQKPDQSIRDLQEAYLKEYAKYGVVVPLRRGVFAQNFEGVPVEASHGRSDAQIYNRYTYGSEKKIA